MKSDMCMSGKREAFAGKLYYGLQAAAVAIYFNQQRVNRKPKHKESTEGKGGELYPYKSLTPAMLEAATILGFMNQLSSLFLLQ